MRLWTCRSDVGVYRTPHSSELSLSSHSMHELIPKTSSAGAQ